MEVISAQLVPAVVAARLALTEAFVLKVGQTLQAVVTGTTEGGLTLLKIGDQLIKAALPETLPTGTTLQLQVRSVGAAPQLAIVAQATPQARAVLAAPPSQPQLSAPIPTPSASAGRSATAAPNVEPRPAISTTPSEIESRPIAASVPAAVPSQSLPQAHGGTAADLAPDARIPAAPTTPPAPGAPPAMRGADPPVPSVPSTLVPTASAPRSITYPPATGPVHVTAAAAIPVSTATVPQAPVGEAVRPIPVPLPSPPLTAEAGETPPPVTQAAASAPRTAAEEPELAHPLLVAQGASRPQPTLAELPRTITTPPVLPQPALTPLGTPPGTPQAALSQMLPEALARQDSVAPLLHSLAALVQKPAVLPEPVLRAALGILAQRIAVTDGKVQAPDLERAVQRSGLGLEAMLAKGEAPAPADTKAGLLALRAALTKWLGGEPPPAPPRETAPPPLKGLPLRAPPVEVSPLPDAPRDALRIVHGQADAAVSRLKLMQLASLPDAVPGRPAQPSLRLELPFLIGHELVMAQLQVSRDGSRRETERKRGWTMRFALNFSAIGEVGAEVGLLGKAVNVALWAAEPDTAEAMEAGLPALAESLEAIGLKPGTLRIRHGAPQAEKAAAGRLLDNVS